jgi:hypothetical protein
VGRLTGPEADTARADIDRLLGRAPAATTDGADEDADGEG